MTVRLRRGIDRFRTDAGGRNTRHSFSFGAHYDPDEVGFGAMVALNDERLPPGTGYRDHPHRDLEIVSVVLTGALRHQSEVGSAVLGPGEVQLLSAGSGVRHAETADDPAVPTRFLQTWIRPTEPGGAPSYARSSTEPAAGWVPLAGGDADLGIGAAARLMRGQVGAAGLMLPDVPRLHVFCTDGEITLDQSTLGPDDALALVGAAGTLRGTGEVLVWALD